ncbi:putative ABC transporter permease subunit [Clostridium rectalis]|uniref:putative ABC transporter permease subunit n=1 Tax=Clostridium rectalis TaxID=2040295 RepID=UPI000F636A79|nr:ABC transporter permease [Clostridium rectalis]
MNKFFSLIKINLKMMWDMSSKKKKTKGVFFLILMALAFLPMIGLIFVGTGELYDGLLKINQQGIILALGASISALIIFVFGIVYCIGTFYFSTDIEKLLYLPLKPSYIVGSKFFTVILYEYLTQGIFLIPILVQYGIKSGANIVYYIYSIIIFLINPIIPLVLASVIIMIIMRFTNVGKNKDKLKIVGWIFSLTFAIGINLVSQNLSSKAYSSIELQNLIMEGSNSMAAIMARNIFPSSKLVTQILLKSNSIYGILYLLSFIAINTVFLVFFLYLSEKFYFKGVIGISETTSKRKALKDEELSKAIKMKCKLYAYFIKEIKILFRTPIYLMNCVIMNFLWPVFFMIPIFTRGNVGGSISSIKSILNNSQYLNIIIPIFFAVIMFISSSNGIASTAVSREGKNLYINKYIPINSTTMFMGKILSAVVIEFISTIIILIIVYSIFKVPIYMIMIFLILSLEAMFFTSFLGLLIDLNSPKLNWDNEQRAVKQNFNLVINMVASIVLGTLTALLVIKINFESTYGFIFIILLYTILNFMLYYLLKVKGKNILNKINL